jgi:hypothetical protein
MKDSAGRPGRAPARARVGRRGFAASAGAALLAAPFVRLLERPARAAAAKRLVVFATPNGTIYDQFWPGPACEYPTILKPLERWRSKLLVMRGINMTSAYKTPIPADHLPDFPNALTGFQRPATGGNNGIGGISIDQHVAAAIGGRTKFASFHLGVQGDVNRFPLFARGLNQPIGFENNPQKAYARLFGDLAAAGMGAATVDAAVERLKADRLSVLDAVKDELGVLRCRVGASERFKLDAHLDSIREVEKTLSFRAPAGGCRAPAAPPATPLEWPQWSRVQIDLLAAAIACDLTRVAGFQYSFGGSNISHVWADAAGDHHAMSHALCCAKTVEARRELVGKIVRIETWYATQFALLVERLDGIPEGTGTLLDNTAALWIHEQSDGNTHSRKDMPYVLAGGCGGYFKTGRCLQFNGESHSGLLISLAHAMDVPTREFGDPELSAGPLERLRG